MCSSTVSLWVLWGFGWFWSLVRIGLLWWWWSVWVAWCVVLCSVGGAGSSSLWRRWWLNRSMCSAAVVLASAAVFRPPVGRYRRVADALGLERRVQRLGHGVVVAVVLGADRGHGHGHGLGFGEPLGVANRSIMRAPVAVMDQAGEVRGRPRPRASCRGPPGPGRCAGRSAPAGPRPSGRAHPARTRRGSSRRGCGRRRDRPPTAGLGRVATKCRRTRSRGRGVPAQAAAVVVLRVLLSGDPAQARGAHEPLDGAPGRPILWLPVQRGVDLPGPMDTQIL